MGGKNYRFARPTSNEGMVNRAVARLMIGVEIASVSEVERAMADGASVDGIWAINRVPPICLAANRGHVDIIRVLVHRGADLEIAAGDGWGSTPTLVVRFDDGSREVPLNRSRALHAAIFAGKLEALRVLLEAGANPNSTNADGSTPLMTACEGYDSDRPFSGGAGGAEQRVEMTNVLLNAGADPTLKGKHNGLAVHYAAAIGASQAMEVLLNEAPSTINFTDDNLCTPLTVAAYEGHESTVSSLLSAGACKPAPWMAGLNKGALLFAVQRDRQNVVRILLDQGLEAIDGVRLVPEAMRDSIQWEFIGILRVLLNVQGEEKQEFWANHPVYHSRQLEYGGTVPAGASRGRVNAIMAATLGSPMLHVAARYCSLRAAHVLLSAGADETAVDTRAKQASDLVGDFQADDKKDAARESGLCRMFQRGPAFRARSWTTWTAGTGLKVDVLPDMAIPAASSIRRALIMRIFRAERRDFFSSRFARYAVKDDHPFLQRPLRGYY